MEIERKFKIKSLPDLDKYEYRVIEQGYLCTDPVMRVRKENDKFYMTYKGRGFLEREEYNLPLNKESYEHLVKKADGVIITKNRYLIPYGEHTIELDVFKGAHEGLIIAEVEFETKEKALAFQAPDWFAEDVTEDPSYTNSNLSRKPLQ